MDPFTGIPCIIIILIANCFALLNYVECITAHNILFQMPKTKSAKRVSQTQKAQTSHKAASNKNKQSEAEDKLQQGLQDSLKEMVDRQFSTLTAAVTEQVNLAVTKATTSNSTTESGSPPAVNKSATVDSQGDALQTVLDSILASENPGEHQVGVAQNMPFDLPLGSDLPQKTVEKIKCGEYVDLYAVLFPHRHSQQLIINTVDGKPTVNVKQQQQRFLYSIDAWTSVMNIYGAIYLTANPNEAPQFLKYVEFVRGIQKQVGGYAWRTYDESFRRVRKSSQLSWDKPLIAQYLAAINSQTKFQYNYSFRNNHQFRNTANQRRNYCWRYQQGTCTNKYCRFSHKCSKCDGLHTSSKCDKPNNIS